MKPILQAMLYLALASLVLGTPASAEAGREAAAIEAAKDWLVLVDSGRYGESWERAASLFRTAVSRDQWQSSVGAARAPFGKLLSRRVLHAQYADSLPGAPDGQYVVIQFEAVYQHKKSAIETVTPMLEGGEWRVSGYYIN